MEPQTIGIAVVGAGRWGNHLVRNFLQHPDARLVALVDRHWDHLHQLAKLHQLARAAVLITDDWDAVVQRPDITGVAIATPASTHADLIRSALNHGKHVLVEKPITLDALQALELCDLAKTVQRQLVVDHTYLFNAAVGMGQTIVQRNQLGRLRYGYASRTHLGPVRQDVDALWDLAIHDIAIFCHWLNAYPTTVQAQGSIWLQPADRARVTSTPALFPQGLSDLVWVTLNYPGGLSVRLHLCWANPDKQRRLCLVGDAGTLIFDELQPDAPLVLKPGAFAPYASTSGTDFHSNQLDPQIIAFEPVEPLRHVCDHFLTCVRHNQPSSLSPGELGAKYVAILTAIAASLNQGGLLMTVA